MPLAARREKLAEMHDAILGSAKTAISATESSVSYLREQREGTASRVRELMQQELPARPTGSGPQLVFRRRPCCLLRLFRCCR